MGLELSFTEASLRESCTSKIKARRTYGEEVAEKLIRRIADLQAADNPMELIIGNPQILNPSELSIDLGEHFQLIITSGHINHPVKSNGFIDWEKITRVKIIRIEKKCKPL